ncbi:MAG TPA: histidine ammonia-lyase [Bacteroidetes bacterium]|nr:histidine ammonia-lyase [Bacteroidota bacterium]
MDTLLLDGNSLTVENVNDTAYGKIGVRLSSVAKRQIKDARSLIESWIESEEAIYGVTTGFGEFSNVRIGHGDLEQLQENLILSHAAGAGDSLPPEIVRAMMLLRINALAKGFSGIRQETVDLLVEMLNRGIVPVIPSQGSVGASGDLVQLAHLVLTMIGRGKAWTSGGKGREVPSARALKECGLAPVRLTAKEGLALINGTQMMTAFAALAAHQSKGLCRLADVAAAISVEALRGSDTQFDERIHKLRPYRGQLTVARNLRRLMKGSEIRESHRRNDPRVQDAYSIRCIPQVHGASRDAVDYVHGVVRVEINSATDNPLVFPKDRVHLEGGNFHGQPIALAMDFLAIALSEIANISERRIERLVNGTLSGLPRFLTEQGGLNSGLMIAQYTAASLVSENKVLCHPGSVDSIPTSANQEDHVSMGSIAVRKAKEITKNVYSVIAIEITCGAQALDFRHPLRPGFGARQLHEIIRQIIPFAEKDRVLYPDFEVVEKLMLSGRLLSEIENRIGKLN